MEPRAWPPRPARGSLFSDVSLLRLASSALLIALGCEASAPGRTDSFPVTREPQTVSDADSLRLTLHLPAEVAPGAQVPITLRAENVAGRPLDLYLRGRTAAFDVTVESAAGDTLWRRLEGEVIPAIVQMRTLAPGERLELRATWDQRRRSGVPAGPGDYTVRGALLTDVPEPLRPPPAPLRIRER
jgi:Intracellular proteinase inhibitor